MSRKRAAAPRTGALPVKQRYYNKSESKALIKVINVHMADIQRKMDASGNAWRKDWYAAKLRRLEAQRAMLVFGCKVEKPILLQV
jgi:hypothetical protein